jgi:glycerol uptake facilitator protein
MLLSRKKIAMVVAEFLGTGLLTLAFLVTKTTIGMPYFVALGAGLVVALAVLVLGSASGAHLNPAITIGLWTVRRVKTLPAVVYIAAQLVGGAAAYLLFTYYIGQDLKNNSHFDSKILVSEAVGAFVFSLGWAAVVYQKLEGGMRAAVLGLSIAAGVIVASVTGYGMVNPAVALGMHNWAWASTVLGPVLGALIGFNLYALLFAPLSAVSTTVDEAPAPKKKK